MLAQLHVADRVDRWNIEQQPAARWRLFPRFDLDSEVRFGVTAVPDQDAERTDGVNPGSVVHVYDPADGRLRWKYTWQGGDDEVRHDRVLVRTAAATGVRP